MMKKFWCPDCEDVHIVSDAWQVTGTGESLTISPSVLVYERKQPVNEDLEGEAHVAPENVTTAPLCHSLVRNGHIEFLSDSTHELAGKTVAVPPLP